MTCCHRPRLSVYLTRYGSIYSHCNECRNIEQLGKGDVQMLLSIAAILGALAFHETDQMQDGPKSYTFYKAINGDGVISMMEE